MKHKKQKLLISALIIGAVAITSSVVLYLSHGSIKVSKSSNKSKIINEAEVNEIAQDLMSKDDKDAWKNIEVTDADIEEDVDALNEGTAYVVTFRDSSKTITDKECKVGTGFTIDGVDHVVSSIKEADLDEIKSYCKQQYQMKKYAKDIWDKALKQYANE